MGFGNWTPFERKEPVQLTFGMLHEQHRGFTVICRKCGRRTFIDPKAMRFLRSKLPDDLKLEDAGERFRCNECQYDRVRLSPEPMYSGRAFARGGPLT